MLSAENKKKIVMSGLYGHEPVKEWRAKHHWGNLYWCMNWTFVPHERLDGSLYMVDTYFSDTAFDVTDENIDEWNLIFDYNDVKEIHSSDVSDYKEEDLIHVAVDSGGMSCGGKWFVRKDAKKEPKYVAHRLKWEIDSLEYQLQEKRKELEKYL